jgi:hypothetical protein
MTHRRSARFIELRDRLDVLLAMADELAAELQRLGAEDANPAQRRQRLRAVK